ncbi:MAG TPA: protein translocase subunit SecD [Burkholderiales bacterium]
MNRYSTWQYLLILAAVLAGLLFTLPNFFGSTPAVQVTAKTSSGIKLTDDTRAKVAGALAAAKIETTGLTFDEHGIRARFKDEDTQLQAKGAIENALVPDHNLDDASYSIALSLLSNSPEWLTKMHALPMYLGLDLRGGVHFLYQVDMKQALTKRLDSLAADLRSQMRNKNIRHSGIDRTPAGIVLRFRDDAVRTQAKNVISDNFSELTTVDGSDGSDLTLVASLKPESVRKVQENAIAQNITTFNKRINATGVAEPVIQQQGADRIVVELPGVQDPAPIKELLGRTASLELRMVCESPEELSAAATGNVPFGCERYPQSVRPGSQPLPPILVRKRVDLTGDRLTDAQPGFDGQTQEPAVVLNFDSAGAATFKELTRENVGKRMAILLLEKNKGEVVTAPVIKQEIAGGRVQISGAMSTAEANNVAILLRSGALAAPMEIIEERNIGPSQGKANIEKGFHSTWVGFSLIAVFMIAYYLLFGVISVIALGVNLLFLVALLSGIQATLTLPGIAAIALALGMAIDSNVLINERIREELRNGSAPQAAITAGYERAFGTILDSNVTTLIAGIALFVFGSGPVRGFAVVHCLGILTSIFSSVVVSRSLVNLIYGGRRRLATLSIGQVWRPGAGGEKTAATPVVAKKPAASN